MKRAIFVVSFGTSVEEAWNSAIKPTEDLIRSNFDDLYCHTAITSKTVYAKLKARGRQIHYVAEGFDHLYQNGFREIYLQPLHLLAGFEYDKIKREAAEYEEKGMKVHISRPLLCEEEHVQDVSEALRHEFPPNDSGCAVVLAGHGTAHMANAWYEKLEDELKRLNPDTYVGTIEEGPEEIIGRLKDSGYAKILLMPFLLVAGDHVLNDLFGQEECSWMGRFKAAGYQVIRHKKGIGENPKIQRLYVKRMHKLIMEGDKSCTGI